VLVPRINQLPDNIKTLAIEIRINTDETKTEKKIKDGKDGNDLKDFSTNSPRQSKNKKSDDNDDDDDDYGNDDEFEKDEEDGEDEGKDKKAEIENENQSKSKTGKTVTKTENTELCKESFFLENEENAARRVLELKSEAELIKKREFLKWKKKTDSEIKEKEEKEVRKMMNFRKIVSRKYS
jgi:hypothetical protein